MSGKPLTTNEKFYSTFKPGKDASWNESERYLPSIPDKVRKMWNNALNDRSCFDKYGHIELNASPSGHKTIVKNFETGEVTTIVKANSYPNYCYRNEHIKLYSAQTKQNGKVTKEFGQVSVKADNGYADKSKRTYIRNQNNPNGTVTLESTLKGSKFDPNGSGSFGDPFKPQRGYFNSGTYNIENNTVSISVPADEYNPALHYISYYV